MVGKSKNSEQVNVVVRCRPMTQSEKTRTRKVVTCNSKAKELSVVTGSGGLNNAHQTTKTYNFDKVFGEKSTQIEIYDAVVSGQLDDVLNGYNCTVLAYGQTGTGKTFTMEGEQSCGEKYRWDEDPKSGIIPRALCHLFDRLSQMDCEFGVRISLLEIYNEEIYDLLSTSSDLPKLKIFDDSSRKGSVVVSGLTEVHIREKSQVYEILQQGSQKRRTAATNMNEFSSRSHSVFSVTVHTKDTTTQSNMESEELVKIGKLNLVDLAGSENIGRSGAVDKRAREAGNINTSLLTLGRCITALVDKAPHIPYRESKLTRLLQDSLGGSTKTSIIATISPGHNNLEETLSTLDYAFRSKSIHNRPKVNQKLTKKALIQEYDREINRLRREVEAAREKSGVYLHPDQYEEMKRTIESNEANLKLRMEELEQYKELFEAKDAQLKEITLNYNNTKQELQTTMEKLSDKKEKNKILSRHVEEVSDQANQLNTTVRAQREDIGKIHDKVDRLTLVNQHNQTGLESAHTNLQEAVRKMGANQNDNMAELTDLMKQLATRFGTFNKLTESSRSEAKRHLDKLLLITQQSTRNGDELGEMSEKAKEAWMDVKSRVDQVKSEVGSVMKLGEVVQKHASVQADNIDSFKLKMNNSIDQNKQLMHEVSEGCDEHGNHVTELSDVISREVGEEIRVCVERNVELDEELVAGWREEGKIGGVEMDRVEADSNTEIERLLAQQHDKMERMMEEHRSAMRSEMEATRALVRDELMKRGHVTNKVREDRLENGEKRFDELRRRKDAEVGDVGRSCVIRLHQASHSLALSANHMRERIGHVTERGAQLRAEDEKQVEEKLSSMRDATLKLASDVQSQEASAKETVTSRLNEVTRRVDEERDDVIARHQLHGRNFQETTDLLKEENLQVLNEKLDTMTHECVKGSEQVESGLQLIDEHKSSSATWCEEICETIHSCQGNLLSVTSTGETPARTNVYESARKLAPIPRYAMESLEESFVEQQDDDEDNEERENEDEVEESNEDEDENLNESIVIPDKGGVPFFKSKKHQHSHRKGNTPLRTLQSNLGSSFNNSALE